MTPSQMIRAKAKPEPPEPKISPIIMGTTEMVYQAQSDALHAGKCPVCYGNVTATIDKNDQMVTYRCTVQPVFHEWRRTQSFLTGD